ncbi:MAG: rod shape-determining protein MreC [bacterium]
MTSKDRLSYGLYFLTVVTLVFTHYAWGFSLHSWINPTLSSTYEIARNVLHSAQGLGKYLVERRQLLKRIERLKSENNKLKNENKEADMYQRQLNKLQEEMNLPDRKPGNLMAGRVIQSNLTGWERTLRIDRGSRDQIQPGDPVLEVMGDTWVLRGTIHSVSEHYSQVILTSDPRQFVARGRGYRKLRIDHVPRVLSIQRFARVYTAPASTIAPEGLLIGRVRTVEHPEGSQKTGRRIIISPVPLDDVSGLLRILTQHG